MSRICVPNIGTAEPVEVIEILVAPGEVIEKEQSVVLLEGDKASMEIPATDAGVVKTLCVAVGDKVSEGAELLVLSAASPSNKQSISETPVSDKVPQKVTQQAEKEIEKTETAALQVVEGQKATTLSISSVHASPSVRRIARELAVPLEKVVGTGEKGRITKEDIRLFLVRQSGNHSTHIVQHEAIDFSVFGSVTAEPLTKLRRASGNNLAQNWATIPHVTQFDTADITELEAFRQSKKGLAVSQGFRLTLLVFVMKAVVRALQAFPRFNSSFGTGLETLVYKQYFNIGIAVDTPEGLVVPVIRGVDKKSLLELAEEVAQVSEKARNKKLSIKDMQGGCFTISSLGGIGGTAFTPIINAPEVAILGLSKAEKKPVVMPDDTLAPRLLLPLSVSYDHRAIDGAEAARFTVFLSECLTDIRNVIL